MTIVRLLYLDAEDRVREATFERGAGGSLTGANKSVERIARVEFFRPKSGTPYHCIDTLPTLFCSAKLDINKNELKLNLYSIAWTVQNPAERRDSNGIHLRIELHGETENDELVFARYGDELATTLADASNIAWVDTNLGAPVLPDVVAGDIDDKVRVRICRAVDEIDDDVSVFLLCLSTKVKTDRRVSTATWLGKLETVRGVADDLTPAHARIEWVQTREMVTRCPVEQALHWRRWFVRVGELTAESTSSQWNALVDTYLAALRQTQGDADTSFVPRMLRGPAGWGVSLHLQPQRVSSNVVRATYSLHALIAPPNGANGGEGTIEFPNLPSRDAPGQTLRCSTTFHTEETKRLSENSLCLDVAFDTMDLTDRDGPFWLRFGSLDMAVPSQTESAEFKLRMQVGPMRAVNPREESFAPFLPPVVALTATFRRLKVLDPVGGAEDAVPDEYRSRYVDSFSERDKDIAPLLKTTPALVFQTSGAPQQLSALLQVDESTAPNRSRGLVMRLLRDPTLPPPARSYVRLAYISREPFLIGLVELPSLASIEADYDEIGNRSLSDLEGARWELASAGAGFSLLLPPQTVGEEMVKSKAQPISIEEPGNLAKPIDYRLGSPARLQLRSSYFRQRFAEAPWNLRRVLGYAGQRAPGALVQHLRFELAYGLATEVDARDVPVRLHLAELGSRMGAVSEPVDRRWAEGKGYAPTDGRRAVFDRYRLRWARAIHAYRHRLGLLELYSPGEAVEQAASGPQRATGSLALEDGLRFTLREGADLRYPIVPERRRPPGPGLDLPNEPPHAPDGLRGGVTWPFESDAIYRGLWRDPSTTAGSISRVFFSSLGGYGQQRAAFDNRRTLINTTTVMGRLSRLAVERVGRIGVLWNRAKHVIVYERTTLASKWFADDQLPHEGRALLRKVEEYVEILQPQRDYPDFGTAALPRGCVEASTFVTTKIPVDGRWGRDADDGFEIPLWKEDADPRLYPKPIVNVVQSGDKREICARVATAVAKPDRLHFYSATAAELDDRTDLWPAVLHVDYTDEALPEPEADEPMSEHDADAQMPDVLIDPPGWERFTWPLEEPAHPTNIVAERTPDALSARLYAVTMTRGAPVGSAETSTASAFRAASRVRSAAAQSRAGLLDVLSKADALTPAVRAQAKREIERARARFDKLKDSVDASRAELTKHKGKLEDWKNGLCAKATSDVTERVTSSLATVTKTFDEWRASIAAELAEFNAASPVARELAHELVDRWAAEVRTAARPLSTGFEDVVATVTALRDQVEQTRLEWMAEFDRWVEPLENGGYPKEQAIATVLELNRVVGEWLEALDARLPKQLPPRAAGIVQRIREQVGTKIHDTLSAVFDDLVELVEQSTDEYLPPLQEDLAAVHRKIFGDLANDPPDALTLAWPIKLLDDAVEKLTLLTTVVSPPVIANQLDGLVKAAHDAIDRLPEPILPANLERELLALFDDVRDQLSKFGEGIAGHAQKHVHDLLCTGGPLEWTKDVANLIDQWKFDEFDKLGDHLDQLADVAGDQYQKLVSEVSRRLAEAVDGAEDAFAAVQTALKDVNQSPTFQDPGETLRLIRAVGEGPILPEIKFNRNRIAYFFDDYAAAVRTSPAAALVNRVGDDLKALGLRVPMNAVLDRIVPDSLQKFDLGKVMPDFAGLKNNELFRKIKLPAIANENVKVKHGLDKATQSAWLKATVDVPLSGKADVFRIGPLALCLLRADLRARSDMTVTVGQGMQKHMDGEIVGDWQLAFGGAPIVTFERTLLHFDASGKMRFDIDPAKIKMDRALKFLADLIKKAGEGKDGFSLELMQQNGMPIGVRCSLSLPLPPISGGAFALSGLTLGASLMLLVDPQTRDFTIAAAFNLGEKAQPFTLTISFLGGGGWVETRALYVPSKGTLSSDVSIGLVAGAGAAFAFGPARGSVYLQVGVFIEFHSQSARARSLSIGIMLLVRGNIVLCGFIDICLVLLLQATYHDTGTLICNGTLSVTVKISRFFKIRVRQQITYKLAGKKSARALAANRRQSTLPSARALLTLAETQACYFR